MGSGSSSVGQIILPTHRAGGCGILTGEPKLEELLAEPIVLLVARRDGVSAAALRELCERIRATLRAGSPR